MARKKARNAESNALPARSLGNRLHQKFSEFAQVTSRISGRPATFLIAVGLVILWGVSGPLFDFSDTWQLVINTSTTIVTFLMVFLIQNTQYRDALAVQLKLSELILAMDGVPDKFASIEDLSDDELEALHTKCRKQAETTLEHMQKRNAKQKS